jgi:anti-anti-sigma regulatory factor
MPMSAVYEIQDAAIHTRRRAEQIAEEAKDCNCTEIDLSGVEFVSRSVADELFHQSEEYDLQLVGLQEEVRKMVQAVSGKPQKVSP